MVIYRWLNFSKTIIQQHPKKNQIPTKNHPTTSCKSSNPGNPDMAYATLRYQTNK